MMVTPFLTFSSPGFVASQFPPVSAARSTITEPCFIAATIYAQAISDPSKGENIDHYLVRDQLRCGFSGYEGLRKAECVESSRNEDK